MKKIELEQGSPEWLDFRNGKIGASDAPIIMGESKWSTPLQLWERKMGITQDTFNPAMAKGSQMEPIIRDHFIQAYGLEVSPAVIQHADYEWMIASLDGLSEDGSVIVEFKYANAKDHSEALKGRVPKHYFGQLQHQAEVAGAAQCHYYSYNEASDSYALVILKRDDVYIAEMLEKELEFKKCLDTFKAPAPVVNMTDELVETINLKLAMQDERRAKQEEVKKMMEAEKLIDEKIVRLSCETEFKACGISLRRVETKGTVDYLSIPELEGVDLDKYRKPNKSRWQIY